MRGKKTGGRLPGTPNKKSQEIRELLGNRYPAYHPVLALAEIANDPGNDVTIRLQANKEVAKYICPQLKSIEVKEQAEEVRIVVVRTDGKSYKPETLKNIENE